MTDARGLPLAAMITAGQAHESTRFESLMDAVRVGPRRRPLAVAGDKAYDVPRIRRWCRRRGIRDVIPRKRIARRRPGRPADLDRERYRRRNTIERCIGWLKSCRRVATRFEKLATHFLAMIHLAIIQRCLRLLAEPSNTT